MHFYMIYGPRNLKITFLAICLLVCMRLLLVQLKNILVETQNMLFYFLKINELIQSSQAAIYFSQLNSC